MGFREEKRMVKVTCVDCFGTGMAVGGKCTTCGGSGEVERPVVEIVHDDKLEAK